MRPNIKTYSPGERFKFVHHKRDGIWVHVFASPFDRMRVHTRLPTDITESLRGFRDIQSIPSNMDVNFYGELFVPGERASAVKHYIATGELDKLSLEGFATRALPDYASLTEVDKYLQDRGVRPCKWETFDEWSSQEDPFRDIQSKDIEGYVLKDGNLENWRKHKPVLTADLVLVGYKEGKGKFAGTVGALILKSKDGETDVSVSGMTDEEREYFHLNREALLGSVIEVRFQRYESRGGMRHPAFVRIREDKTSESAD